MADDRPAPEGGDARPGLARETESRMAMDIEAMLGDRLLAQSDIGNAIALDLEASAGIALPTLDDLGAPATIGGVQPGYSLKDIEALLSLDAVGGLADEGSRLNDLLDRGGASIEERNILRNGMLFLRRGRYHEAGEWWALNAPVNPGSAFAMLLQVLRVMTYRLQGDEARAAELLARLRPSLERAGGIRD